jgi:hypothetical protein
MSESDRTPGKRNRSHVPPLAPRASTIAYEVPGASVCSRQAAPIPDRPAPTMRTSTCSAPVMSPGRGFVGVTARSLLLADALVIAEH